jgi:hypothetical protein
MTSLAFSPTNFPRISYAYDYATSSGVALSRLDGFNFDIVPLDSDPLGGLNSTSLEVDKFDISHILYVVSNCPPSQPCSDSLEYERISSANTPIGAPVTVNLGDPASYGGPITVTFSNVSQVGVTTVSVVDPSNGPAPPANFELGNPPIYFDFSTTATYAPPVRVCIPFGSVSNPSSLVVMHYENGVWVNRTATIDLAHQTICADVNSFSPIAIFQSTSTTTTLNTTLTSSANSSVYGEAVTFMAGLTGTGTQTVLTPAPTGTITFYDGANPLGSPITLSGPSAALTISTLIVGTHSIIAQYSGDSDYAASSSNVVTQMVNKNASATTLMASATSVSLGQTITLTSLVSGAGTGSLPPGVPAPTGSVTFFDGSTPLSSPVGLPASGLATLSLSSLTAGAHSLTSQYGGDANYAASSSTAVQVTVTNNSTTISLTSSGPSVYGQLVAFTANLTAAGGGTLSGNVTFVDSTTGTLGSSMVNSSGVATFQTSSLSAGTHAITAMYGGNGTLAASTTSALPQVVSPAPLFVTASSASAVFGSAIPVVTPTYAGFANSDTSANLSTMPVCIVQNLPANDAAGTYTTVCSGAVDPNYAISYATGTLTIVPLATSISWTSPAAIIYGTSLGAAQLDASASVAGMFSYSPGLGTVLSAGNSTLTVVFTPTDTVDYKTATAQVSLAVNKAPLSITALPTLGNNISRPYGANNPAMTPVITGIVNGDPISASDMTMATPSSPVGVYAVTSTISDPANRLGNYAVTLVNGTLTVVPETTALIVTLSPSSIVVGQSSTATITLSGPDMVSPMDPSVLASVTLTSAIASDVISNGGVCTPVPTAAPGTASCTLTVTSSVPNGRTLTTSFAGSPDLAASTGTAQLIVTEPVQGQQSCIQSDFKNVAVPGGSYIWLNSIFRVRDVSKQVVHITFANSTVQFQYTDPSGNPVSVNLAMPNAQITIDPSVAVVSSSYDPVNKVWNTTLPWDLDDNAFLSGMPWLVPAAGLPADVEPVTWCGTFAVDVPGAHIGWRWAAAAYSSSFSGNNAVLGVKPMDTDGDNPGNHDLAGTPENYKQFLIPGARGKGRSNYTGSYSRSSRIE